MLINSKKELSAQFSPKPVAWPESLLKKKRGEGGQERLGLSDHRSVTKPWGGFGKKGKGGKGVRGVKSSEKRELFE